MRKNEVLPFQYEEKEVMAALLEEAAAALKDSDAAKEKEMVKEFLRSVSERLMFVALGNTGVGKTSLLNEIFQRELFGTEEIGATSGICEFRYGEEEAKFQVSRKETRYFRQDNALWGISVVDTEGIRQMGADGMIETLKGYMKKSDVIFAVFEADSVRDHDLWDVIEEMDKKKIVFVLTKCDGITEEQLETNQLLLQKYMKEAGIEAPVFPVSSAWKKERKLRIFQKDAQGGYEGLRRYVKQDIIGSNPVLTKQQDNLKKLRVMLTELNASFELRKKQYQADAKVLEKINSALDVFCLDSRGRIDSLKEELKIRISEELREYQKEVVAKLDPKKIKERFPGGSADFVDYMNLVNEAYRKKMTDQVNREAQKTIRSYLSELEDVFDEATGYFRKRESLLKLEDKFYGTLAENKDTMIKSAARSLETAREYYHSLADASEELFLQIWQARDIYERKVRNGQIAGFAGGAAGAGAVEAGIFLAMGEKKGVMAGIKAVSELLKIKIVPTFLLSGLVIVVSGIVVMKMAKKIFSARGMEELEKKTNEAVGDFKAEVLRIKEEMTEQILAAVEKLFQEELGRLDKTFADFRMSVNIDSKNIPVLEERMNTMTVLMEKINVLEEKMLDGCGK